ncbi:MAG: hypothetical protein QF495_02935, partial [SAR324 cluster bacterium]|nr:hypothetical protein [SAR324 cluster bacterium]
FNPFNPIHNLIIFRQCRISKIRSTIPYSRPSSLIETISLKGLNKEENLAKPNEILEVMRVLENLSWDSNIQFSCIE